MLFRCVFLCNFFFYSYFFSDINLLGNNIRDIMVLGGYMKKISILALHLGYGGIEKSIVALANLLCDKYKVEIACTYKLYDKPVFDLDERVKVIYLMEEDKPNKAEFKRALKKKKFITAFKEGIKSIKILRMRRKTMIDYIKNSKSKVIISTRDIFNTWLGDYAKSGVLKIGWEHNHYHDDYRYARSVIRSAYYLDYFVLVSEPLREFYSEHLSNSNCKCVFIPNIIDKIPRHVSTLEEKRIISVGRLSPEKGYIDLLKVFSVIANKYSKWHLDIIGDGVEKDRLEKFITNHNLEDRVTLHGFQNKDYIDKMLHESSIYVMTSFTESFGIVLLEAMSHGLPCIAFDSAEGARDLINSGMNGYLIKNRSYAAMIKKIEDLMNDKDVRKKIGMAGRKSIRIYTSEIVGEQWYNLIEKK